MGSLKPSMRSRASVPSSSLANGGPDDGTLLSNRLKVFKSDNFEPDTFVQHKCQSMNEKEIRQLCSYLLDLKKASAEEMRKSVYANYSAFIRTSKEISDLEGELLQIRNLLSTQSALIHGLTEGVRIDSSSNTNGISSQANPSEFEIYELSEIEKWALELPDILDVLLAERRVDEALTVIDEGEQVCAQARHNGTLSASTLAALGCTLSNCQSRLADQLAETINQQSTRGAELRAAISALKKLGDGSRAHTLLLNAHHQRLQYNMQSLRPSSTSYGGAYTAALAQLVFSAIAQAASDSVAVFGDESVYASELVMWSTKLTEDFAHLVKRHALASSAAAGGLRAAAECVQIALGHCSLLESRGLALCPILLKLFRPSVEQALVANLKRIEESTSALAAADDWMLSHSPSTSRLGGRASNTLTGGVAFQLKLSGSAYRFNSMVQDFFEDVAPLLGMQLAGQTLEGLARVFNSYVSLLIKALPGSFDEDENAEALDNKIVRIAESETQQIALIGNAAALADELLPRAALKLSPSYQLSGKEDPSKRHLNRQNRLPEQREWRRRLQRTVDRLRDIFCRQHALDVILSEDGHSQISAEMYISPLGNNDSSYLPEEHFPSLIFQELFMKLNKMSQIASEMLPGRERVVTLILMRLTDTVILWLSNDQMFWEEIEDGPKPLGYQGLLQFVLDMQFVIQFASQGRYLSRHMHQVLQEIIMRAINAFGNTGIDPYRLKQRDSLRIAFVDLVITHSRLANAVNVLPEEDWFADAAYDAILKLSGQARFSNGDREPNSPTASVSDSGRSHGSQ